MPTPQLPDSSTIIFSDFDGTITREDVTDRILEELADPSWREFEDLWVRELIGSRECLQKQIALVEASRHQLNALIDSVPLDAGFQSFHCFTRRQAIPFYVVSDGFDYVIRRILKRAGANGELRNGRHLYSSSLAVREKRLRVNFPFPVAGCEHGCATCKPAAIRQVARDDQTVVFIGDGLSDRFAVEAAEVVFAKKQLLAYCRERGIACLPFETFADIQAALCGFAPSREPETEKAPRKGTRARSRKGDAEAKLVAAGGIR
jgi:2-hydroxy-3-keto-5-methylthiopentenyl-1-phosphate phosphatase